MMTMLRTAFWLWLCRYTYARATKPARRPPVGLPLMRDPNFPCNVFEPGPRGGFRCFGDGHYLCHECAHFVPDIEDANA